MKQQFLLITCLIVIVGAIGTTGGRTIAGDGPRIRTHNQTEHVLQRLPPASSTTAPVVVSTVRRTNFDDCCLPPSDSCVGLSDSCNGDDGCGRLGSQLAWRKDPWSIVPFGSLTGEMIGATEETVPRAMILFLQDDFNTDDPLVTVHGQTTALGLNFAGPSIGEFQIGGMILFNFLGQRPVLNQSSPFFLRGYGELKNDRWRFAFGQMGDLFNPVNPTTINFGGHKQAGNAGAFRGAFRLEHYVPIGDVGQWQFQTALSQQTVNDFVANPIVIGTDNGWPNFESRVGLALGQADANGRPFEVGVSSVFGETRAIGLASVVSDTWGASLDARIRGQWMGVGGEIFVGEAIGTYNAGIGQSLNPITLDAIQTVGGWAEIWVRITDRLTAHVGHGIDDPKNQDLGQILDPTTLLPVAGQRERNEVSWGNLILDVTDVFQIGFEISYRETSYLAPSISNNAMLYHFRARISF